MVRALDIDGLVLWFNGLDDEYHTEKVVMNYALNDNNSVPGAVRERIRDVLIVSSTDLADRVLCKNHMVVCHYDADWNIYECIEMLKP